MVEETKKLKISPDRLLRGKGHNSDNRDIALDYVAWNYKDYHYFREKILMNC